MQQWGVDGYQIRTSYEEWREVKDIAYTSDGTRFVSCGGGGVMVRESESGMVVVKIGAPDRGLNRCCILPDGRFVACASGSTVLVWDITIPEPRLVGHLAKHSDTVLFITFSSSFISVSKDRSIKLWQSSGFMAVSTTADDTATLHSPTQVNSINLFAKEYTVVTSDSSGVVKTHPSRLQPREFGIRTCWAILWSFLFTGRRLRNSTSGMCTMVNSSGSSAAPMAPSGT